MQNHIRDTTCVADKRGKNEKKKNFASIKRIELKNGFLKTKINAKVYLND